MKYNTNYYSMPYRIMLDEIGHTKPLSRKEEQSLFQEYENASEKRKNAIKEIILQANLRFVLKVALSYKKITGANIAELFGEGKMGLLEAFDRFDWRKKFKFISYAVWQIRMRIGKYLSETDLIKIPSKKLLDLKKCKKTTINFKDLNPEMYYIHELINTQRSFDEIPIGYDISFAEMLKDENVENLEKKHLSKILRKQLLEKLYKLLDTNELTVLKGFFGFVDDTNNSYSLRDLGDQLNKSHERIRQIRDNGLRKLQKSPEIANLYNIFQQINV